MTFYFFIFYTNTEGFFSSNLKEDTLDCLHFKLASTFQPSVVQNKKSKKEVICQEALPIAIPNLPPWAVLPSCFLRRCSHLSRLLHQNPLFTKSICLLWGQKSFSRAQGEKPLTWLLVVATDLWLRDGEEKSWRVDCRFLLLKTSVIFGHSLQA